MTFKPWKLYSIEDSEHTWGYTVYLPVKDFEDIGDKIIFKGWILYPDDGGYVNDRRYGKFSVMKKDDEEEEADIGSYNVRDKLDDRWIADYVMYGMIKDVFEKDINKYVY